MTEPNTPPEAAKVKTEETTTSKVKEFLIKDPVTFIVKAKITQPSNRKGDTVEVEKSFALTAYVEGTHLFIKDAAGNILAGLN